MNLTEFLLARIAEDEDVCHQGWGARQPRGHEKLSGRPSSLELACSINNHVLILIEPSRVLVECEAKRRIVEIHSSQQGVKYGYCEQCWDGNTSLPYPCPTLQFLALPYADHPDYCAEWKP